MLATIDAVILEFIKGAQSNEKLKEKKKFVEQIIESYLHEDRKIFSYAFKLVEMYKEEGKSVSMTDFILGATLMYYHKNNLLLLTKNPSDFPTNIFKLKTYMNLFHRKAIQSYGVYSFEQDNQEVRKQDAEAPFNSQ
ncbi:MAG: type II toxin-antitoxin system VapC family toxin [Candidatus Levybacteria bacterium]|nr:type II toxin-antitoxin system VapC family toxin [Candidatus Levybacteria bacterium]